MFSPVIMCVLQYECLLWSHLAEICCDTRTKWSNFGADLDRFSNADITQNLLDGWMEMFEFKKFKSTSELDPDQKLMDTFLGDIILVVFGADLDQDESQ